MSLSLDTKYCDTQVTERKNPNVGKFLVIRVYVL